MSASVDTKPSVRVLVVEDGEDQRFLMQRYFELAGCVVVISSVLGVDRYPASDARFMKPVSRANVQDMLENFVPGWAA